MEEFAQLVPVLIGITVVLVVIIVVGGGLAWLLNHPLATVDLAGCLVALFWYGARRNRV